MIDFDSIMSTKYTLTGGSLSVLNDCGVDVGQAIQRGQLTSVSPSDEGQIQYSIREFFALWRAVEELTTVPNWWLRAVEAMAAETFSAPVFAALSSPNLKVALQRISRYKRLFAANTFAVTVGADEVRIIVDWPDRETPPASLVMFELLFPVRLAEIGTHSSISPLRIETPFAPEITRQWDNLFNFPIVLGARHAVYFSSVDATVPFVSRNETIWSIFEPQLNAAVCALNAHSAASERVRAVLRASLPGGQTDLETIAHRLNMSKRTLQRKLQIEGISYQDILRETRADLADFYRANTSFSRDEIAFMLGYQDTKSLQRLEHAH